MKDLRLRDILNAYRTVELVALLPAGYLECRGLAYEEGVVCIFHGINRPAYRPGIRGDTFFPIGHNQHLPRAP